MMKYSEFWEIQDAASAELDKFSQNYLETARKEKTAENKVMAEIETAKAKLTYLTAYAAYMDFIQNTVAEP